MVPEQLGLAASGFFEASATSVIVAPDLHD
jgi:hypothetical protein